MVAAFEPVFSDLAGWRRIYLDLPGTGASPPSSARSDAVLDAVAATVDEMLDGDRFLLAGCSYGGYLAAGLVRRMPQRVVGLLAVCAGVKIRPEERNLFGVLPSAPQPQWLANVPMALHGHFSQAIGRQTRAVADRVAHAFAGCGPTDDDYLNELRAKGYPLSDEGDDVPFEGTVMLLAGRRDRIAGYVDLVDALPAYPRGNFVAVGDAGHYLPFEKPGLFKAVTRDWLAESMVTVAGDGAVDR
jgi:pimeloyl-ACP methyl ester carboxylesterase